MKKMYILKGMLLAFLAFQFISCENEPIKGDFPEDDHGGAAEGQFKARIAGEEFIANSVIATLSDQQKLTLKGSNSNGKSITIVVDSLVESNYTFGNVNLDLAWALYQNASDGGNPYTTSQEGNATGSLMFSDLDRESNVISGTFNFRGVRIEVDENGMPVIGEDGNPVIENIDITNGSFNSIEFTSGGSGDGEGDGEGDGGEEAPEDEFFAKINGTDFITDSISVTQPVVGNNHMVKIEARTATHDLIRIDIPRNIGLGTFDMQRMSDGTKLIGLYKENGGENLTSNPGTITITEFDLEEGVLVATFRFTAKDPLNQDSTVVEVTQGRMNVYFEGIPGANNVMLATVNGEAYAPEAVNVESDVVNQYPRVTLMSTFGDQQMKLSLPRTITVGTHEMVTEVNVGNEIVGTFTPVVGTSISYYSNNGTLVVTNYDVQNGVIEGTFEFTAVDASGQDPTEYEVTGGEFLVVLP